MTRILCTSSHLQRLRENLNFTSWLILKLELITTRVLCRVCKRKPGPINEVQQCQTATEILRYVPISIESLTTRIS